MEWMIGYIEIAKLWE